jgi:kumamolisin
VSRGIFTEPTNWGYRHVMAENRVALPGSEKRPVAEAEQLGAVHPEERVEVTIRVRSRGGSSLTEHLQRVAGQPASARQHLSREAFAEQFGADPADLARVEAFARANNLAVVSTSAARRSVVLGGTASQLGAAFGVQLETFAHPDGGSFRGRQGAIYVSSDLADVVEGVFGLDDRPVARPHMRRITDIEGIQPLAAAPRTSFSPAQIGHLYDFPTGVNGHGQSVAIIELGGGFKKADLTTYFKALGITPPRVVAVSVDHGKNAPSGPNGADGEVMLDIEVVGAVAPGATIVVYFAPNTDQGFIDAITTAVHDTTHRPSVISISWGSPEVQWTHASVQTMDQAFQAAAAMGVTVYAASGDNGANDFPPGQGNQPGNHADFPASSPHVMGCGGTHITASGNTITNEVVWNDPGDGASGGGFSTLFPRPTWQPAFQGQSTRGVPDVSGDASPLSGYAVRVDGQNTVIGGTSAVAPLWSGLTALLNQKLGKPVGFLNPTVYALSSSSGAFHDITSGNNNGFSAQAGWDPCTGLGRPDGAKLVTALAAAHTTASAS